MSRSWARSSRVHARRPKSVMSSYCSHEASSPEKLSRKERGRDLRVRRGRSSTSSTMPTSSGFAPAMSATANCISRSSCSAASWSAVAAEASASLARTAAKEVVRPVRLPRDRETPEQATWWLEHPGDEPARPSASPADVERSATPGLPKSATPELATSRTGELRTSGTRSKRCRRPYERRPPRRRRAMVRALRWCSGRRALRRGVRRW